MPDKLLVQESTGKAGRKELTIARVTADGTVLRQGRLYYPPGDRQIGMLASTLCTSGSRQALVNLLHRYLFNDYEKGVREVPLEEAGQPAPALSPAPFRLRGKYQPAGQAQRFATLDEALAAPCEAAKPLVEWDDIEETCCLDLDFHGVTPPAAHDLACAAERVEPAPRLWWLSKSGGLHAVYDRRGEYTAEELAAAAGFQFLRKFPTAVLELKRNTYRPPEGASITAGVPTDGIGFLRTLLGSSGGVDEDQIAAWLDEQGLEVGKRYEHERCPGNPSPRAQGNSPPVVVYDDHIYCYICAGDGRQAWFSYAQIVGTFEASLFGSCVRGLTHWGHARHFLPQQLHLPEALARVIYRVALRQQHGEDPRVKQAFTAGGVTGCVRCNGYWTTEEGETRSTEKVAAILAQLPAVTYPDEQGKLKPDPVKLADFTDALDLTRHGYPPITQIRGVQFTANQTLPPNKLFMTVYPKALRHEHMKRQRPQYLPPGKRLTEGQAWGVIERAYPGVNRAAITLLLIARGCTEACSGMTPMLFLSGPTGSGKTGSTHLAAAIAGDVAKSVVYRRDPAEVRMALLTAKRGGGFALLDEYLKGAAREKHTACEAMETLLGFTPDTQVRELYVGYVDMNELPVCCWADTTLPAEVQQHSQIARRLIHVPMPERLHWEPHLKREGIYFPGDLRTNGSSEFIEAANAILSAVIDQWFPPGPPTDFFEAARAIGFRPVEENNLAAEKEEQIRRLFKLVCELPEPSEQDRKRYPGPGWKVIQLTAEGEAQFLWLSLADPGNHSSSRAVSEADLKAVLQLSAVAECETKLYGQKLFIRFRSPDAKAFNQELTRAPIQLEPEPADLRGPGNAEPAQPPEGWWARVPPRFLNPDIECGVQRA